MASFVIVPAGSACLPLLSQPAPPSPSDRSATDTIESLRQRLSFRSYTAAARFFINFVAATKLLKYGAAASRCDVTTGYPVPGMTIDDAT